MFIVICTLKNKFPDNVPSLYSTLNEADEVKNIKYNIMVMSVDLFLYLSHEELKNTKCFCGFTVLSGSI